MRPFVTAMAAFVAANFFLLSPAPAAQNTLGIAAVVNGDVISMFDLFARVRLSVAIANLPDGPEARERMIPPTLRTLIDEKLQLQEAKRFNIRVQDKEIDAAILRIEKLNNIGGGGLRGFLASRGVDLKVAVEQIRAGIAWQKLIARRFLPRLQIGDEEVDRAIAEIKTKSGTTEFQVAEIFLAVDSPEDDNRVKEAAKRLANQIRLGANFAAMAQQFSQSATAASGGDLGWLQASQTDASIATALAAMQPGQVSDPIRSVSGHHILLLRDSRKVGGAESGKSVVMLRQIFFPVPESTKPDILSSQNALAETIADSVSSCPDMKRAGDALGSSVTSGAAKLKISELPAHLRTIAAKLPVQRASKPLRIETGILLVMVCERESPKLRQPDRQSVLTNLRRRQLELMARRYLRDLRRAAYVDMRV